MNKVLGIIKRVYQQLILVAVKEVYGIKEPDISKCPNCGGEADNGFDRCVPPNSYYCTKCANQKGWDGD